MTSGRQRTSTEALFGGRGELRRLCRQLDWRGTPLGPVDGWKVSLRTAVRLCLDARPAMAVWVGPDAVLIYNEAYAALLGPDRHPWALGRPGGEVFAELWARLGPEVAEVMSQAESTVHVDEPLVLGRATPGGTPALAVYSFLPVRDDAGQVVAALHVVFETTVPASGSRALRAALASAEHDLDERRRADEAVRAREAELREAQRLARLGSWEWTVGTEHITWSEGLNLLLGRRGNAPPPTFATLGHFFTAAGWERLRRVIERAVEAGEPYELELEMLRPDGKPCWTITRGEAVRDDRGRVVKLRGTSHDITERKQAEQERERLVAALREADQHKNDFLGVLSHELRNPLTPIRNSLHILNRATPGGEQDRRARAIIDRQITQLTRLVDDLLDVTRISRGKIRLQRTDVDLVEIVRQTLEDHRSLLEGHELAVELPDDALWIDGDPTRIAQMVSNLLGNAAKFTPAGGRISVTLARAGGMAVLEVSDTGLGIEPWVLPTIFEPFAQGEHTLARTYGGLGLGLALVKGLVELHGGSVSAHSDGPGRGARFTLELPLQAAVTVAVAPSGRSEGPAAGDGLHVLVIEDNRDAAASLGELLELDGYHVTLAHDGKEGVAKAREHPPDVLLCDIGLPEMRGYEVARAFRAEPALRRVYLVALTGYASGEDQQRAVEAGFHRHLAKPPSPQKLEEVLALPEVRRHGRAWQGAPFRGLERA